MRWALLTIWLLSSCRKDLAQTRDRGDAALNDIPQHIARAHRWQLIDIANQQQMRVCWQRLDQAVEQLKVEHGRFVDHHHIRRQRIVLVVFKAADLGGKPQQPMNRTGGYAGGFGQALGSAPGRRRQFEGIIAIIQRMDQHLQRGGFAGTGTARQNADLAVQRRARRLLLFRRQIDLIALAQIRQEGLPMRVAVIVDNQAGTLGERF